MIALGGAFSGVNPTRPWLNTTAAIEWFPWQKKFAWKPAKLNKTGKTVWLRFYYTRSGRWINPRGYLVGPLVQNGTLFDVIQTPGD